jgi:hypothetical protein
MYEGPTKYLELWAELLDITDIDRESMNILLALFLCNEEWGQYPASVIAAASITFFGKITNKEIKLTKIEEFIDQEMLPKCLKSMASAITQNSRQVKEVRMNYSS